MNYGAVSIIIPAWNESRTLKATLQALLHVEYDKKLCEVIVVAGGHDDTYEMARNVSDAMSVFTRYVVVFQKPEGKNAAIHEGIKKAQSPVIVLLDADTVASEHWLKRMVGAIEKGTCDLAIANPEPVDNTWVSDYYTIMKGYLLDNIVTYSGNSMAFKADVVEGRLGYFFDKNVKVGVDYLLARRFMSQGLKVAFVKEASVVTHVPACLKYFVLTELRWLTARMSIDGVRYRDFLVNTVVVVALISAIPLYKPLFMVSMLCNAIYISKRIRIFRVGLVGNTTKAISLFGFLFLSYVFQIVGFVAHMKRFLGLSKEAHLYQGQRP